MDVIKNRKIPALLVIALLGTMSCVPYFMSTMETQTNGESTVLMAPNALIEVFKTGEFTTEDLVMAISEALLSLPKTGLLVLFPQAYIVKGADALANAIVTGINFIELVGGIDIVEDADLAVAALMEPIAAILGTIATVSAIAAAGGVVITIFSGGLLGIGGVGMTLVGAAKVFLAMVALDFLFIIAN